MISTEVETRIIRSDSRLVEEPEPNRIRNAVIAQALREQADAVLLQPTGAGLRVLYRIADHWNPTMTIPSDRQGALTASFREAAGLGIQSAPQQTPKYTRRPEPRPAHQAPRFDMGLILFEHEGREYDIYISFLPTRMGEKMALRLLPKSDPPAAFLPLELLQM